MYDYVRIRSEWEVWVAADGPSRNTATKDRGIAIGEQGAVAESARGSGDVFSLPLALLDPLLSPSQGSHKGPEGPRESGVFAFCPSVRRHECREQPLRQQQAPRRALSRAIPVVNAQRSGSTHAQSEAPARPVSHYSFGKCWVPALSSLREEEFRNATVQIVTESERTCSACYKRACWVHQRPQQGRWHAQAKKRSRQHPFVLYPCDSQSVT